MAEYGRPLLAPIHTSSRQTRAHSLSPPAMYFAQLPEVHGCAVFNVALETAPHKFPLLRTNGFRQWGQKTRPSGSYLCNSCMGGPGLTATVAVTVVIEAEGILYLEDGSQLAMQLWLDTWAMNALGKLGILAIWGPLIGSKVQRNSSIWRIWPVPARRFPRQAFLGPQADAQCTLASYWVPLSTVWDGVLANRTVASGWGSCQNRRRDPRVVRRRGPGEASQP